MGKNATIKDVAKLAGVSVATVSRVLNDVNYPVSMELKEKVRSAVRTLGYVPNSAARNLRQEVSRDIGLVIPNISNPFYLQSLQGINEVLSKNDYSVILYNTARKPDQERNYLRQLYERQVKGVILSSVDDNADIIKEYTQKGMRFVLLDQKIAGLESTEINFDSRAGMRMATEHLVSKGHKKIAFATLPMTRWTRKEMFQGYTDALAIAGITYDAKLLYERLPKNVQPNDDFELQAGKEIAERFLEDGCPATAIVCINDMLAIGLIKTLRRKGIRVPEDVSVFGFDDIPFAEICEPALSTVRYPAIEAGRLAAMMLLENIDGDGVGMLVSMQLTPSLILRETVSHIPE